MNREYYSKSKSAVSRRDFLRLLKVAGLDLALLIFGGGLYMSKYEPSWLDVTELKLKLPRLPSSFSGIRLIQVSDLHYDTWMNADRLNSILSVVSGLSPDLVAITGDFTLNKFRSFRQEDQLKYDEFAQVLSGFTSQYLTLGTLGYHDYWVDREVMMNLFQKGGVVDLNNMVYPLKNGGDTLYISGLDDVVHRRQRLDLVEAQVPTSACAILLVHEPDFADVSALNGRFDLQISGHTHGGQVMLPLIGQPFLPYLGRKYLAGLYRVGDMLLYTNRGVGMNPPYIRLNCRPEITVFTLEPI